MHHFSKSPNQDLQNHFCFVRSNNILYVECILGSSPFAGRTKPAIGGDRSGSGRMSVMPAVVLSPASIFSSHACV